MKYFYLAALLADTAALPALVSLAGIPHSVHGRQLVRIQLTPGRHLKIFQCRKYFGCENISVVQIVLKYGLIKFDKEIFVKIMLQLGYYWQCYMFGVSVKNQNKAGQFGKYVLTAVK